MKVWACTAAALAVQALVSMPLGAAELIAADQPEAARIFAHSQANSSTWKLMRYYDTQANPAFCGVAASEIVLNSLDVASPASAEISPYSMFNQNNFFTDQVTKVKTEQLVRHEGIELDQLAAMLRTFDVKIDTYHADQLGSLDAFRRVASAALADPDKRVIVNYYRPGLGQKGGGHHSPLGAYDTETDRFLILDVARYRLPPVWATAGDLWNALNTMDTDAKLKRGMLVVSRVPSQDK